MQPCTDAEGENLLAMRAPISQATTTETWNLRSMNHSLQDCRHDRLCLKAIALKRHKAENIRFSSRATIVGFARTGPTMQAFAGWSETAKIKFVMLDMITGYTDSNSSQSKCSSLRLAILRIFSGTASAFVIGRLWIWIYFASYQNINNKYQLCAMIWKIF